MKKIITGGCFLLAVTLCGFEAIRTDSGADIKTSTLTASVRNGIIVDLRGCGITKVWADDQKADLHIPSGLGILSELSEFQLFHVRNGWFSNGRELKPGFPLSNYYRPCGQSLFSFRKATNSAVLCWEGLSNGKNFLPDAVLTMTFSEGENGELRLRSHGSWPGGNVFGILTPIANLDRSSAPYLPLYGGRIIRDGSAGMMSLINKNEDMEAPLMILTDRQKHALGFWIEDPEIRNYQTYFNRTDKSFSLIYEHLNLMYFQDKKSVSSPDVCINVFRGDWKTAAAPFREWFRKSYQKELAIRDGVKWTEQIGTILSDDLKSYTEKDFSKLKHYFPEGSLMFMTWNARKPGWDQELPDWTPGEGYVKGVELAHEQGYKTMAYVNICCANYQSPAWEKYHLGKFFLPQRVSLCNYMDNSLSREEKDNMMNFKVFEGFRKGRLYYGDLLSGGWRDFHVWLMKEWHDVTGTDANYEDTAGCGQDAGNGVVDGLSGAQGEWEQMRQLQQGQPEVPMSSEFLTLSVAGAVSWPLKSSYCWLFNDQVRETLIHDCRPISAYVYGVRHWSSGKRGYNALHRHTQSAMSDALGGFGFQLDDYYRSLTIAQIDEDYSFQGHIHRRALLFSRRHLLPYFPQDDYPDGILCMYRGDDGLYSYYDDGALQEMRGPKGNALYGRVDNADSVRTSLWLENWPFRSHGVIFGLNKQARYPLFPAPHDAVKTVLSAESLPRGSFADRYFETPDAIYLELHSTEKKPGMKTFEFKMAEKFYVCYANGKEVDPARFQSELPLRLVCFKTAPKTNPDMESTSVISLSEAGTQLGKAAPLKSFGTLNGLYLMYKKAGPTLVLPIHVADGNASLSFTFRDAGNPGALRHDGVICRLLINGEEIRKFDSLLDVKARLKEEPGFQERKTNGQLQQWTVPLAGYAGKDILVVLEVSQGRTDSGDKPTFGVPRLIRAQEK